MAENETIIVERYFAEILNQGNFEKANEIFAPDFAFYSPSTRAGLDMIGFRRFVEELRAAFSNKRFIELDRIASGSRIAIRFRMTGTHDGSYYGIPPLGGSIDVEGCDLIYLQNGKIQELHAYFDLMAIVQKFLTPPPLRFFAEFLGQLMPP